jgi:hypothetical protein
VGSCVQKKKEEVGFSCWPVNGLRPKSKGKEGAGGVLLVHCGLVLWAMTTQLVKEEAGGGSPWA